jgi:hypothetical protein
MRSKTASMAFALAAAILAQNLGTANESVSYQIFIIR